MVGLRLSRRSTALLVDLLGAMEDRGEPSIYGLQWHREVLAV